MSQSWEDLVANEWRSRQAQIPEDKNRFPLVATTFGEEEILSMVQVLLSGKVTMGPQVAKFEQEFASYLGAKYAVMVNSGSSANLLALAVLCNPKRSVHFNKGDEILVPAVCWSTSLWPIVQFDLKPVFVDVDPVTMNIDLQDMERKISSKTKGIVAVHVLGSSAPMKEFLEIVKRHNLILLEDTCEGLGVKACGRYLGTFGAFGTYSTYFSHHMTTMEGGMVVCETQEDVDLLKCLRAHGWTRELSNGKEIEKAHPEVDSRFLFVNLGYNLRPMEVQGAMGQVQLRKLADLNAMRVKNHALLQNAIKSNPKYRGQITFPASPEATEPVWFGFCMFLSEELAARKAEYVAHLDKHGVDSRPIISGNFVRQPGVKLAGITSDPTEFPGAEVIHKLGLFIGVHPVEMSPDVIQKLSDTLLAFNA